MPFDFNQVNRRARLARFQDKRYGLTDALEDVGFVMLLMLFVFSLFWVFA